MLNGLLVLCGDKNKMSGLAYRLLHTVLTEDGVLTQKGLSSDCIKVMQAIQLSTGLRIKNYFGAEVEAAIRNMHFRNQVAVCDIDAGAHSILLTGRSGGWIEAFDPDWDSVKMKKSKLNAYVVQPEGNKQCKQYRANVVISVDYLLRKRTSKSGFQMGAILARHLTVIEKH